MSEWNGNLVRSKSSFVLWGTVTVIAVLRYLYEIKCSRRRYEETALGSEDPEAESRDSVAEERLLIQLEEATGPFKPVKAKLEDVAVGDIEEVEESFRDSGENDTLAFSNACAICLEEFEKDDKVVHSVATKECPHIFHEPCMKEVVVATTKKGAYSIPCPCCRQTFVQTGSETAA